MLGIAERAANLHQALHQRVVCDGDIFPDDFHQLLLGDQAASVADQVQQHVVSAGTQSDCLIASEQQLTPGIERARREKTHRYAVISAWFRPAFVSIS